MYVRDGICGDKIEVLPVGCDTDSFMPFNKNDPKVLAVVNLWRFHQTNN
jgi:hypothetical protein